ncbi:DUF1648 domain-containing protein [Ornithinibacillus halophilus]|nr:DUF1648 domain-containing protein [Ornithinibacillus halophilus]
MEKQPKINVKPSKWEHILNALSILVIIGTIIYVFLSIKNLPDTIAIHFNNEGEADGWGSKWIIFGPIIIAIITFIPLYFLSRVPHKLNYLVEVTEQNVSRQYSLGRLFITTLNLEAVVIFCYISWEMIQFQIGNSFSVHLLLIIIFVIPISTIVIYITKMIKAR